MAQTIEIAMKTTRNNGPQPRRHAMIVAINCDGIVTLQVVKMSKRDDDYP